MHVKRLAGALGAEVTVMGDRPTGDGRAGNPHSSIRHSAVSRHDRQLRRFLRSKTPADS